MPVGTAVHERTFALCESLNYREWSGYYAVSSYESHHEHEYNAIRNAAALIDVSPLFKYMVTGPDAAAFEVDSNGLFIKAGTPLDYETKTSYSVIVNVDDATVGGTPDASAPFALTVTDVLSKLTVRIMSPPPSKGGMERNKSALPYSTPMPLGP